MGKNIYYTPEDCGLIIIDTLDESGLSYEYNTLIVLGHLDSGRLYFATDSGCSCPTPFENYHFTSPTDHDLREIEEHNFQTFESEVNNFPVSAGERQSCIARTKLALNERKG